MTFTFYYLPSPAATIEESDTATALSPWGSTAKYLRSCKMEWHPQWSGSFSIMGDKHLIDKGSLDKILE